MLSFDYLHHPWSWQCFFEFYSTNMLKLSCRRDFLDEHLVCMAGMIYENRLRSRAPLWLPNLTKTSAHLKIRRISRVDGRYDRSRVLTTMCIFHKIAESFARVLISAVMSFSSHGRCTGREKSNLRGKVRPWNVPTLPDLVRLIGEGEQCLPCRKHNWNMLTYHIRSQFQYQNLETKVMDLVKMVKHLSPSNLD